jgi:hypothetical protein
MRGLASRRFVRSAALVGVASTGIMIAGILPAAAATVGPQNLSVSCNRSKIAVGVTVTQAKTGDYQIKQNSTSPSASTKVWALDTQGNDLPQRTVKNGGTATWTSVIPSRYQTRAVLAVKQNCSHYILNYTVIFTG